MSVCEIGDFVKFVVINKEILRKTRTICNESAVAHRRAKHSEEMREVGEERKKRDRARRDREGNGRDRRSGERRQWQSMCEEEGPLDRSINIHPGGKNLQTWIWLEKK